MSRRFTADWGWPLATALAMLIDWMVWHRVASSGALTGTAAGYLAATLVLGRLSASRRWRWVWALAGIPALAWSFGMDFTGLTPWVWIAAWRRPAWSGTTVGMISAGMGWVLTVA